MARAKKTAAVAPAPAAPVAPADDFDEHTPPPRIRPQGEPIPALVVVPPGESVIGLFGHWDSQGRIPVGCTLALFVGTGFDPDCSGYVVAALSAVGTTQNTALGAVEEAIPPAAREAYAIRAIVKDRHLTYVVFAPLSP